MRYFSNNEQLINRIADSKPMRTAARFVVSILNRTSSFSGAHQLPSNSKEFGQQLFKAAQKLSTEVKKEIKDAKDKLNEKPPK